MQKTNLFKILETLGTSIFEAPYNRADTDIIFNVEDIDTFNEFCKTANCNIVFYDEEYIDYYDYVLDMDETKRKCETAMYDIVDKKLGELSQEIITVLKQELKSFYDNMEEQNEKVKKRLKKIADSHHPNRMVIYTAYNGIRACVFFDNHQMAGFDTKAVIMENLYQSVEEHICQPLNRAKEKQDKKKEKKRNLVNRIFEFKRMNRLKYFLFSKQNIQRMITAFNTEYETNFSINEIMEEIDYMIQMDSYL